MIYKCYDYNLIMQYSFLHGNSIFLYTQHEGCGHLFCKCHKFSQSLYALSTTTEPNYIKNYYSPSSRTAEFNSFFKTAKLAVTINPTNPSRLKNHFLNSFHLCLIACFLITKGSFILLFHSASSN